MSRYIFQKTAPAELTAKVRMYTTAEGGRQGPAAPGWGCPVMISRDAPLEAFDALPLLRDTPINPGETRRLGFTFLTEDAAPALRAAGKFYLWDGRFVGEATVVE